MPEADVGEIVNFSPCDCLLPTNARIVPDSSSSLLLTSAISSPLSRVVSGKYYHCYFPMEVE